MKIGSVYHILVFFMVVLVFSMSFVTFAQQNSELHEAVIAAEQDAKAEVNQLNWWCSGCVLVGVAAAYQVSQPSPERFVGKSPEYVEVYTEVYKAKVKNLQLSAAVPGCLTAALSPITMGLLIPIVDSLGW